MTKTIFSIFNDAFTGFAKSKALYTKDGQILTYSQVKERAAKLVSLFEKKNVARGSLIAILMDRNSDYIISMMACVLYGYGFIPMDKEYPKERIETILSDSKASFVIDENAFAESANEKPVENFNYIPDEKNIAYVVFTSGSTGRPKGIMHDQASFGACANRLYKTFKIGPEDTWGATAPFTFVAMTFEIIAPLVSGTPVRVIPRDIVKDPELLAEYIAEYSITACVITPRLLKQFKPAGESLKLVITGSEKVENVGPLGYRLISAYGQSETCGGCVFYEIKTAMEKTPIGEAVEDCAVYLLDDNGNEASEGEICISGHFMTGYLNLPEETENILCDNPFKQRDGHSKLIHTRDLGKRLENGEIVYENRKDWMIKINGQRVEPGEIEMKLKSVESILDAAVKGFVNRYGQTYICAYYVAKEKLEGDRLRSVLQEKLPAYMVPSFFIQLEKLPLNLNGKLDRTALKEPNASAFLTDYEAPSNEAEAIICKAFEKILNLSGIGIKDDFFKLGGDSIKAIMVVKECSGLNLSVKQIFAGRTPKGIALAGADTTSEISTSESDTACVKLSDSQMGIFLDGNTEQPDCRYNIPFVLRFSNEAVSIEDLHYALEKTFKHHQAFSLSVKVEHGNPVMFKTGELPSIETKSLSESEFEEFKKTFVQPFDFEGKPLCRAAVVQTPMFTYVLVDIHHLFFDGTSLSVFRDTLTSYLKGNTPPSEAITPFMISSTEQKFKGSPEERKCIEYFKNALAGCEADYGILPDVYKPELSALKGEVETTVNLDLSAVEYFTKVKGVSENILFASAFALTLSKFTGSNESLFISVENGRHLTGMENSIGMFVRSFPVFIPIDENLKTADFMAHVQTSFYEAMAHDGASFADIAHACSIDSSVKFVYQSELLKDAEVLKVSSAMSNLDVMVLKQNGVYKVVAGFRKSMYSEALITSFVKSFCAIADGLIKNTCLSGIRLISDEQEQLLDSFNNTEKPYDRTLSVVDILKQQVALHPDKVLVRYKNEEITYLEFDKLTDKLAAYLVSLGIGTGSFVPVITGRSQYMPVLIHGIIKSGAAYQPLDPAYPADRLDFMVKDSGSKLIIADRCYSNLLTEFNGRFLYTDEIAALPENNKQLEKIKPENGLILLYTSGTTGVPKGFELSHKNLVSFVMSHKEVMNLDSETVYASYAGFSFDACLMDMVSIPLTGGTLCIIPDEIRLDIKQLCRFYTDNRITHGFITTQLGCMFAGITDSPYLKYFMVGGEKLIPVKPLKDFKFINGYGPSETMAYVASYEVQDDGPVQPVGKASSNTKLYVADPYSRRLPAGACGELYISGAQVSKGYINRPEANAKAFVPNPFCNKPDYLNVYKTGDIVRMLPNGCIDFVGRRDGQVKIRGFRIELSEIDKIIRTFEGIKDETVQAFDDSFGGKYLAAYISSDVEIDVDNLKDFIASCKPDYMVPAVVMQVDSIPLTPNGKVDKRKLPVPEYKAEETVGPKNEMQKTILDAAISVIGNERIGITTDLFRAGLSSLGVIRLNALLSDTFNITVQTKDLKNNNTVELLESFINKSSGTQESKESEAVVYPDFPLTKTQEGIFIECQGDADSTVYNIPYLIKISKEINLNRLRISICEAVEAHNSINTILFYDGNGNIRQKVPQLGCFRQDDIEIIKTDSFESIKNDLIKPHKLVGGRLFRICIIEAEENYLYMDFHHIISDGTSMMIFVNDIENSYKGIKPVPEKFTGFDVSLSEQKNRNSHAYLDAEEYYQNLLEGCDTEYLPGSDLHCYAKKGSGKFVYSGMKDTVAKVTEYCRKNGVSENSLLCAAFGYVLAAYNGTESSLFTTVYNGRSDSRMGRTVSMLVKTLPVVFTVENDEIKTTVAGLSNQLVDSMSNDVYSFAEISRRFGVKSDVMFIFQGKGFEQTSFCGKECCVINPDFEEKKVPLSVQVTQQDTYYNYDIDYDNSRFSESFANHLARAVENAVSLLTEVNNFSAVSLTDEFTLSELDEINRKEVLYERTPVTAHLRKYVSLMPDFPAVQFKERILTYKEFDVITDNLAYELQKSGAEKNSYVAVLIGRNEYMPVTAWGVIKSGAAYMPVDPTYPKERISLMLNDSKAKILITQHEYEDLYKGYEGRIIFTDEIEKLPNALEYSVETDEEDPLVLIYSSGSTGVPKGSILPHRSITALVHQYSVNFGLKPKESMASYASFGFDAGLMDIFIPLSNGLTLHIIPEEIRLDIPALDQFFIEHEINYGFMTTQVARTFLQNTKSTSLKGFMFGGEKMVPFNPPQGVKVLNGYGPSETNCYVTLFNIKDSSHVQPIGKQVMNTKLYVLDKKGKRLPPYACGELCIAGHQVALGYLNRPEKTSQSFVENPFCNDKDYRLMYKTGDIVRMFADGNYDFVGRRDGQVKIRGFRIELGEVEQIISEFNGVKQVTAQAFEDVNGGKFIAAYMVSDQVLNTEELAGFIRKAKPSYMVPSFMIQIDSIPLNSNGKVNKAKLPVPQVNTAHKGAEPENECEEKLCSIFASVLGLEKVYADDDFFEIGGTSILALQLVVKCVNEGFAVVYKNIFENPTPHALYKLIQGEKKVKDYFAPTGKEFEKYDYSALKFNVEENLPKLKNNGVGDVLLTGATGFLGIHVLYYLITSTDAKVICLTRSKDNLNPEDRIKMMAGYYFDNPFEELFGSRIFVVDGEFSNNDLAEKLGTYRFDTIINCAANVRHFGSENSLMIDNYSGIGKLIQIAKSRNAMLVQTSSLSVAGESVNGHIDPKTVFKENNLNIGQSLENLYVRSKYLAEQEIIDAIPKGLRAKIIRLGNLMGRKSDAEFQINSDNSGFLRLVNGFRVLGCFPIQSLDASVEFSQIDSTAKALVLLAGTPDEFTVFHCNSSHPVHMANVMEAMNDIGYKIDFVDEKKFAERFAELVKDEHYANKLSGLISYKNSANENSAAIMVKANERDFKDIETRLKVAFNNAYTVKALYKLGFSWPLTDEAYITALFKNLESLNYFD